MERLKIKSSGELQNEIDACENIIKAKQEEMNKLKAENSTSSEGNINKMVSKIENSFDKKLAMIEKKIDEVTLDKASDCRSQIQNHKLKKSKSKKKKRE